MRYFGGGSYPLVRPESSFFVGNLVIYLSTTACFLSRGLLWLSSATNSCALNCLSLKACSVAISMFETIDVVNAKTIVHILRKGVS